MFDSDLYRVKQKAMTLGKKYVVEEDGDKILESHENEPDLDEGLVLHDEDGEPVLELNSDQYLDVATSFSIVSKSEEKVLGGLKREWSFFSHDWNIIGSENNVAGIVTQKSHLMSLMRRFIFEFFPFRFEVRSQEGEVIGRIKGKFSVRDNYLVELKGEELDPRLLVGLAVLIDIEEKY